MEENKITNVDLDKMYRIVGQLEDDKTLNELIEENIQYNFEDMSVDSDLYYDELGEVQFYCNSDTEAIKEALKKCVTENLTNEEKEFLIQVIKNNIEYRSNVKKRAHRKATYYSEEPDLIDMYGSQSSVYEHKFNHIIDEEYYYKTLTSSLEDYIEYLGIKQNNR